MIYITATVVIIVVTFICWLIDREERDEELKGQLTKKDLRDIAKIHYKKNQKK